MIIPQTPPPEILQLLTGVLASDAELIETAQRLGPVTSMMDVDAQTLVDVTVFLLSFGRGLTDALLGLRQIMVLDAELNAQEGDVLPQMPTRSFVVQTVIEAITRRP